MPLTPPCNRPKSEMLILKKIWTLHAVSGPLPLSGDEGFRGGRDDSAYVRFHRSVYITVGWLEQERQNSRTVDASKALAHLAQVWASHGPIGKAFEKYYRNAADNMVTGMAKVIVTETARMIARNGSSR